MTIDLTDVWHSMRIALRLAQERFSSILQLAADGPDQYPFAGLQLLDLVGDLGREAGLGDRQVTVTLAQVPESLEALFVPARLASIVEQLRESCPRARFEEGVGSQSPRFVGCADYHSTDPRVFCLSCEAEAYFRGYDPRVDSRFVAPPWAAGSMRERAAKTERAEGPAVAKTPSAPAAAATKTPTTGAMTAPPRPHAARWNWVGDQKRSVRGECAGCGWVGRYRRRIPDALGDAEVHVEKALRGGGGSSSGEAAPVGAPVALGGAVVAAGDPSTSPPPSAPPAAPVPLLGAMPAAGFPHPPADAAEREAVESRWRINQFCLASRGDGHRCTRRPRHPHDVHVTGSPNTGLVLARWSASKKADAASPKAPA